MTGAMHPMLTGGRSTGRSRVSARSGCVDQLQQQTSLTSRENGLMISSVDQAARQIWFAFTAHGKAARTTGTTTRKLCCAGDVNIANIALSNCIGGVTISEPPPLSIRRRRAALLLQPRRLTDSLDTPQVGRLVARARRGRDDAERFAQMPCDARGEGLGRLGGAPSHRREEGELPRVRRLEGVVEKIDCDTWRVVGRRWYGGVTATMRPRGPGGMVGGGRRASATKWVALSRKRAPCEQRAGAAGWCATRTVQRVPDRVMLERERRAKGERDGLDRQAEIEDEG